MAVFFNNNKYVSEDTFFKNVKAFNVRVLYTCNKDTIECFLPEKIDCFVL